MVTVDDGTKKVTRSGQYWAFSHYSRHIRRGARVFQTNEIGQEAEQGTASSVSHAGFRNPDGSFVVVLANRGPEKQVQLLLGSQMLEIDLPASSVHTLQWA